MRFWRCRNQKAGNALLVTLLLMSMVFTLSLVVGHDVLTNMHSTSRSMSKKQAYYSAQAGLQLAIAKVNQNIADPNFARPAITLTGELPGQPGITYSVVLDNNADGHLTSVPVGAIKIDSTVVAEQATAFAPLQLTSSAFQFRPNFGQALLASNITVTSNSRVTGSVVSADNISVDDGAFIDGNLSYRKGIRGSDGNWVVPAGLAPLQIGGARVALTKGQEFSGDLFAMAVLPTVPQPVPDGLAALPATESLSDFPPVPVMVSVPTASNMQPYMSSTGPGLYSSVPSPGGPATNPFTGQPIVIPPYLGTVPAGGSPVGNTLPVALGRLDPPGTTNPFSLDGQTRIQAAQILGVDPNTLAPGSALGPTIDGVTYLSDEYNQSVVDHYEPPILAPKGYANIRVPAGQTLRLQAGEYHIADTFQVDGTVLAEGAGIRVYVGQKLMITGQVNAGGVASALHVLFTDKQTQTLPTAPPVDVPVSTFTMTGGSASMVVAGSGLRASLDGGAQLVGSIVANSIQLDQGSKVSFDAASATKSSLLQSLWSLREIHGQ